MRKVIPLLAVPALAAVLVLIGAPVLRAAQSIDWSNPAARQEMQDFQQFLTGHPWIANKLRQNPPLANDPDFLNGNRELPQFLNSHAYVQSGLRTDADGFMLKMQDFAASPAATQQEYWDSWDNPENRQEAMDFQYFLNAHTWLAKSLHDDPSLANNQGYLNDHAELQRFLSGHPYVQHALQADATSFMHRMQGLAISPARPSGGDRNSWSNPEQQQEMQDLVQFFSDHPWIANKLRQDPSLTNNPDFVNDNPPLPQFLNAHPYVQAQFRGDPNGFMLREQAFASEGMQAGAYGPHAADYFALNQFMLNHPWIGKQLKEKPSRANSDDFLNDNKELRDFLQARPYLQQEFKKDPRGTIDRASQMAGKY